METSIVGGSGKLLQTDRYPFKIAASGNTVIIPAFHMLRALIRFHVWANGVNTWRLESRGLPTPEVIFPGDASAYTFQASNGYAADAEFLEDRIIPLWIFRPNTSGVLVTGASGELVGLAEVITVEKLR